MNLRMGFENIDVVDIAQYIYITVKCDCWCFDLKRSTSACVARHCAEKGIFTIIDVARSQ